MHRMSSGSGSAAGAAEKESSDDPQFIKVPAYIHTYIPNKSIPCVFLSGHAGPTRCVHHDDREPVFGTPYLSTTIPRPQCDSVTDGRRAVRVTLCSSER